MKRDKKTIIHNRFDFVVRDAKTEKVIKEYASYNTLLNTFWTNYIAGAYHTSLLAYIQVGDSGTTPVATDTALGGWIGGKAVTDITYDYSDLAANGIATRRCKIRLEASEYNGTTIREVGMAKDDYNLLVTKSLIKDSNGNTLAIEKDALTIIDIYATFFIYLPAISGDFIFNRANSGILRWMLCADASLPVARTLYSNYTTFDDNCWGFGEAYSIPGHSLTFDATNKKVTIDFNDLGVSGGNIGGLCMFQPVTGVIIKMPNSIVTSSLIEKEIVGTGDGTNKDFVTDFGRLVDKGNNKVYVDDVEVSATFNYAMKYGAITDAKPILKHMEGEGDYAFENITIGTSNLPLTSIFCTSYRHIHLYVKDTLEASWTYVLDVYSSSKKAIPAEHQLHKYIKFTEQTYYLDGVSTSSAGIPNVTLAVAPAIDAVVTVTYDTNCIHKNSDTVLNDLSMQLVFGEYTPA